MGAGHARSRYLNRKEGDAEGRASDWSEVVTSHMDSSMCSSAPDPEMWIIQGTLAWRTPPVRTGCMDSYLSSTGLGSASMGKENGAPNNASSQTKNYEITPFILGDQEIGSSRKKNACYFTKTCQGKEEGENKHTWRAQYNGELYAAFGKDESLPKRNLLILSQLDGPAAPGKRIEEASDYFMHAPLGSGGYSSVGRAPPLQLGRCDYGWSRRLSQGPSSEIPGEEDQVGPCEQLDALSPFNPLSEMRQKKRKENPWTDPIISTPLGSIGYRVNEIDRSRQPSSRDKIPLFGRDLGSGTGVRRQAESKAEPPLAKGDSHANPSRAKVRPLYLSFFILDFVLQGDPCAFPLFCALELFSLLSCLGFVFLSLGVKLAISIFYFAWLQLTLSSSLQV
ncbi:hypothetical protein BUALT_Bualt16G0121700 [Buddleja alternifolia]|uniref:Uncharacterized protein n=1 Tax=Buddleja alternifolia TaxID=168488 RepID=A0AAV6WCI8_9LAMI|nr:hypothetical protein BUALT_Bualt16G0121700 [Buddleja alternifolia]